MTFPDFEYRAFSKACREYERLLAVGPALASVDAPAPAEAEQLEFDFDDKGGQHRDEREPSCTKGASRQS